MSAGTPSGTYSADFDQRGAFLTFDALEKAIIHAVADGELEVAAEYVDQLFLLAEQLDEYHEEYRHEAERLAAEDLDIQREERAIEIAVSEYGLPDRARPSRPPAPR